jgi:hypothetical protein
LPSTDSGLIISPVVAAISLGQVTLPRHEQLDQPARFK